MRRFALAALALFALGIGTSAEGDRPQFPRVPRGFDEGRTELTAEVKDGLVSPGDFVKRLFEEADLPELSGFVHLHLLSDEVQSLDAALKLEGELHKCRDATGVLALFRAKSLTAEGVSAALGKMLVGRKYSLADTAAWLYARGFNFNVLQRALNGERLDALRLRASLRAAKDKSAAALFLPGMWEYNLNDAREELGGTYDGVQAVECLLALGWKPADFAKACGQDELPGVRKRMIEWGDAKLIWPMLEHYVSESELIEKVIEHYKAADDPRLAEVAMARAATTYRWFRTGGPGVSAVYRGPWPDSKGQPQPPTPEVMEIGDADNEQFTNALSDEIRAHFTAKADQLTIVLYDDGSARALLDRPGREPVNYGADSPFGNVPTTKQAYEGRVSLAGRSALMYLVYANGAKSAPTEWELANVKLTAGDAFLLADIDDGVNFTPILLRRVSRLVE
ncbi:MAG: hypothetical protein H6839_17765 [Planctomycetes bacterium]|nr:hypothetical protein [Planctomycetota bacterium]